MAEMSAVDFHRIPMESMKAIGWKFWQAARKGKWRGYPINPKFVPIGYYRSTNREGVKHPVSIYTDGDGVHGDRKFYRWGMSDPVELRTPEEEAHFAYSSFQHLQKDAITKVEYDYWMANRAWPPGSVAAVIEASQPPKAEPIAVTEPPVTLAAATEPLEPVANERAVIGDNSEKAGVTTPEILKDQIDAVIHGTVAFRVAITADQIPTLSGLRNRLAELASSGEALHKVEKAPNLAEGRGIDAKWFDQTRRARAEADRLKKLIEAFHTKELAEKRRAEAEAAAASAPIIEKTEPERIASAYGKQVTVKPRIVPRITDYDVVYQQFKNLQPVKDVLDELARKAWKNTESKMAGVDYVEEAGIR